MLSPSEKMNVEDFKFIREMAGCYYDDVYNGTKGKYDGNLRHLDIANVKFIGDGNIEVFDSKFYRETASYKASGVGRFMFAYLENLQTISLPNDLTSIDFSAFYGCKNLADISLPEGMTSINQFAFNGCSSLTSIILPKSLTYIGGSAFAGCSSLVSISIPVGITKIEAAVFDSCTSLVSVSLPEDLTYIDGYAFSKCSHLASISLPKGLTYIENDAFYGCSALTSIYTYMPTPIEIKRFTFDAETKTNATLYVPQGSLQDYHYAEYWSDFLNIVEFNSTGMQTFQLEKNVKETARYSANGQLLHAPTKGVNLIRYNDGSIRKVIVR